MGFYIGPLLDIPASFGSGPCWVTMGPLFNSAFYFVIANIFGILYNSRIMVLSELGLHAIFFVGIIVCVLELSITYSKRHFLSALLPKDIGSSCPAHAVAYRCRSTYT